MKTNTSNTNKHSVPESIVRNLLLQSNLVNSKLKRPVKKFKLSKNSSDQKKKKNNNK